ncbi:MAG TPA: hypothetical protein VMT20_25215 [Terriglobia bacterium]|nr:hypothetical protein [Terriglobia bacterium]
MTTHQDSKGRGFSLASAPPFSILVRNAAYKAAAVAAALAALAIGATPG